MLVIPSVDIRRGRCVQLVGGRPETERVYGDPVELAQRWVAEGANYLHLVDLDAAMGTGDNFVKVAEVLANTRIGVEVGGGVRTLERANELLGIGADRVILGTAAVRNPGLVRELVELAGGARTMVALDSRSGKVAVEGWKEQTEKSVLELAREFERMGVGGLLFTSIDVEGSMRGIAAREIRELVNAVKIPVFASGGVGSLDDVRVAREAGAAGLVVGVALYEGRFTLKQAMEVAGDEDR
ncbi:MAG: 1-(5-phosphoribosyl)-5-[(5-phosphoribosylamino)methylideneamino]imidazole-4-carboxamide isomerase [Candidatus Hodarchaeaceae archaeon]|nr:1-(5-phosphoribosyl)-5-[(5-phosphoribosylamino)methylideneamino]imidazole-4-carboxamide isomerase [Candidatus Hodarchaeaceae archaeon]